MAPLMLTAIAVAFAFRCGMFNIGGQAEYLVGLMTALYLGTRSSGTPRPLHVLVALPRVDRRRWGLGRHRGILEGDGRAHEVISTIMLNWIAILGGSMARRARRADAGERAVRPSVLRHHGSAKLWPIWGALPSLHAGLFIALFALVVYYVILNRTTLGYEVRASASIQRPRGTAASPSPRNYFLALAISGLRGLAGSVDLLGFKHAVSTGDFSTNFSRSRASPSRF